MTDLVLVTGGTGFIGRHTIAALRERRLKLRILVRATSTLPEQWTQDREISVITLTGGQVPPGAFEGVSSVVHMAGLAHVDRTIERSDEAFGEANTNLTAELADLAIKHNVRRFVHLSSLAAGTPNATEAVVDDTTNVVPSTAYGASKRQAELYLHNTLGSKVLAVSLRPPLVIGAQAPGNWALLQRLADSALWLPFASVQKQRSYISVRNLASAILQILGCEPTPSRSGSYVVADQSPLTLAEIVAALREGMQRPTRLFPFPSRMIMGGGIVIGRRRQFAGLLGQLVVDSSRFQQTFGNAQQEPVICAVRRSGAEFSTHRAERKRKQR